MVRAVALSALLALLVLVPWLPSANPPERFLRQVRIEHALGAGFWGPEHAARVLARTLDCLGKAGEGGPPGVTGLGAQAAAQASGPGAAVANEMAGVSRRLFGSAYFRSLDALLALAAYRFFALAACLPLLAAFALAALADGLMLRMAKAREFRRHDPELFALYGCGAVLAACAAAVALVLPVTLHPGVMAALPLAGALLVGRAAGCFHGRG